MLLFVTPAMARRIEQAEAEVTRAVIASARDAPNAFWRPFEGGAASYLRPDSPMNKVIGVGLDAPIDPAALSELETELRARGDVVRVELATVAMAASGILLTERSYRLLGFEDVWLRPLTAPDVVRASGVEVERVDAMDSWRTTTIEAVACPDGTGVPVDQLSRRTIEVVIDDVLEASGFDRYVASVDGVAAGAASMFVHDGIALLTGSATLPAFRRRGVQTALIVARLDEARRRDAELAAITTPPASRSGANAARHGFALGYTRAILVGRDRCAATG
jgi:GNAT superfamily N-acetyltransferase